MGATDAKVITADQVVIDERVRAKCTYPKCHRYGTNANCQPYAMAPEEVQKIVNKYRYALFIKLEVPPEKMAGTEARDKNYTVAARNLVQEIVAKIESAAFYDGYYLALGFACGACKSVFCPDVECSAIAPGQACRFPLKARSPMEGVGMDAYTMATRVGWDIYPIGASLSPAEVPYGTRLGLVLVY